ncbi:MAG TPA: ABC transporter permease [Thermoanaerobaculia bacterium]|nr:ABC transporter permease [Thermoanaerobaculia bacterium]
MKFFPYVFKSLFRKKTRSLLTIASIVLPLFVICIMGTLLRTLDGDPSGGRGMFRLIVRHKVSLTNWVLESYMPKIAQLRGVTDVVRMNWFGGAYIDQKPENMFARFSTSDPGTLLKVFDEAAIVQGSAKDWIDDRTGLLAGELLMKKYGWKLGQKVTLKGDIYPVNLELTIRATFKGPDETGVYFHHQYIEEALPRVKGFVGWYWIKADSLAAVERLPGEIDAMFDNSSVPTRTETEKEMQNGFVSMLGNVKLMVTGISTVIVLVILLIAGNTMAMAARERVTEIAVLRTLGYPKGTILGMMLGESVLLALVGGTVGAAIFVVLFPGFRQGLLYSPMGGFAAGMKLFPEIVALAFGISVLVGVLAGLVPAIRSSRRSITDGLRQVG